ncbi:hypothetical protein MKR37_01455 [Staphylococcus haemolyticus]|uniref:hypothetical protein n=1 Tax=Staphylococcus haemolyticus TaxID=1283 RepID=UPI001F0B4141|nr:hypothetical protein [Staphylococcus haemolyticus]MCH4459094.1 hypothetical protein [Staphylococcus haemolyticus]MCH4482383.1 hypothetical protein [Staphylococcus haemolyticus]
MEESQVKLDENSKSKTTLKIGEDRKDLYVALALTMYVIIKTYITGDYKYIISPINLKKASASIGNILNDLIIAYIPLSVLTLTLKGKNYRGREWKERLLAGSVTTITFVTIFAITYFANIHFAKKHNSTNQIGRFYSKFFNSCNQISI